MGNSTIITATFLIVTPAFGGGVDPAAAELRAASIKGALRFWWRFLAWSEIGGSDSQAHRLVRLRYLEALFFGHAGVSQSALSIWLEPRRTPLKINKINDVLRQEDGKTVVGSSSRYLGYGALEAFDSGSTGKRAGQLKRSCLQPGQGFTVHCRISRPNDDSSGDFVRAETIFRRALRLFGLVGGLGSRARRGWGSLALHALEGDGPFTRPSTLDEYSQALRTLLPKGPDGLDECPPFTTLGQKSRIDILIPDTTSALEALESMGAGMQRYRAWGHKEKVNGQQSEKNFKDDHDWSKPPFGEESKKTFVPRRAVFGLPHNYGQNSGVTPATKERRASPLMFHVHALASDWYIGVGLLLPARFLPGEEKVRVKRNGVASERAYTPDWTVLTDLLDGPSQSDPKNRAPYYGYKEKVWP
jgi:CRISPR-associated protein Cmr1